MIKTNVTFEENITNCLTKDEAPSKLASGSTWQCGPSWLCKPRSNWPDKEVDNEKAGLERKGPNQ